MILCLTHSNDFYTIDIVQQHLLKSGYSSFRLNTDEFATSYRLNYSLQSNIRECFISVNGQKIYASQIQAVWYRKLWNFKIPPELDPSYRDVFLKEYQTYLHIFFNSLNRVPWMNNIDADHAVCNDKLNQLMVAQAAGLKIPASVFTNETGIINNFFEQCNGNMIVKLHGALSKSMDGNDRFFPTTRLALEDLANLDSLAYCPMIFQEYIPKAYELRIVYVDGEFFTGQITVDAEKYTDWRTATGIHMPWKKYTLPVELQYKIGKVMNELGLSFGAIDMIRHTNGEYVFLEVNPQGEWGMLQKHLSYPIGETIAEKLISRIKNEQEESIDHYAYRGS